MIKQFLVQYWWVASVVSLVWWIVSVWWTVRAELKFRWISEQLATPEDARDTMRRIKCM